MLPATGLEVGLVPGQADDVDEEAFREAVAADDGGRLRAAEVSEGDPATSAGEVALLSEALHHLRDRLRGVAEPFDEARLNHRDTLLVEAVHGLEVLLDGGVDGFRHGEILPPICENMPCVATAARGER